ncbi:hypothetical protein Cni_G03248 [Canna indica]|uniref:Uncharacterized protein n=1 Tax=Canna indica TaxID=4628 RepID=A0AAQ3JT68_9LILI|nr:hypothetical protein Cni_G03248 [Canna indica]
MSLPLDQQSPPAYTEPSASQGGSIGPVIGVLAMIAVLGVVAGVLGRLCSGRSILGYGRYDLHGWVEAKCATCIDGRPDAPAPRSQPVTSGAAVPAGAEQEAKRADHVAEA